MNPVQQYKIDPFFVENKIGWKMNAVSILKMREMNLMVGYKWDSKTSS